MRLLSLIVLCVVGSSASSGADEKPKIPADLKGTWKVTFVAYQGGFLTSGGGIATIVIDEGTASWGEISTGEATLLKAAKGTIKVDADAKPPTIEFKSGDLVYKGIYGFAQLGGEKKGVNKDAINILFSPEGGGFPREFSKDALKLPEGFKGFELGLARRTETKEKK
jgi:hypothetical protein